MQLKMASALDWRLGLSAGIRYLNVQNM